MFIEGNLFLPRGYLFRAYAPSVRQHQRIHRISKYLLLGGSPPPSWDYGAARDWLRSQTKKLRKTLETVADKIKLPKRQMRQRCLQEG